MFKVLFTFLLLYTIFTIRVQGYVEEEGCGKYALCTDKENYFKPCPDAVKHFQIHPLLVKSQKH